MAGKLTRKKAATILSDKEVRGRPLTKKQVALFNFIKAGGTPIRLKK